MSHAADAASHLSTPVRRRPKTPEADVENGLLYHPPASPRDWTADDEQREVLKHAGGRTIQEQDADAFVFGAALFCSRACFKARYSASAAAAGVDPRRAPVAAAHRLAAPSRCS